MVKPLSAVLALALLLCGRAASAQTVAKPTNMDFQRVCNAIYNRDEKLQVDSEFIDFRFEELMLEMAGAIDANHVVKPKEEAFALVRKMWLANRGNFRCFGYTGVLATERNVGKFSMGVDFPVVLNVFMKKWKLDLGFKDAYDGKTIYQFLLDEKVRLLTEVPKNEGKILECDRMAAKLKTYVDNYQNPDALK
ncbi:hypothetical protein ACFST9_12510 [Hymenobacter monticola]|uniref:DUF4468 domain-containing protein n=1 Tax=Hymenobacter monticola TaxID=1705399 RepID=A0ABY4BEB9_9BACT|nr:hypothetical protein [Hymenobacter monticola]UOE34990.1 hypothetical protein MTP16_04900 [Hymenobacter monticola]